MWHDDITQLSADSDLWQEASPVFRFFAHLPWDAAHPYEHVDAYEAIFACFAPVLKARCDRIRMWDNPGANARRGSKIKPGDWTPFQHIRSVNDDVDSGMFIGFDFLDAGDTEMEGRGPASFRFFVGSSIRLEACIPAEAWAAGEVDLAPAIAALEQLPYYSFLAGYGLCHSSQFENGARNDLHSALHTVAERYPALDLIPTLSRDYVPDGADPADFWIAGINWITGVGQPFVSALGDSATLTTGLPAEIEVRAHESGVTYRLGKAPTADDPASLALYRALGQRLQPIDYPSADDPPKNPVFGSNMPAQSLVWLRRFHDA